MRLDIALTAIVLAWMRPFHLAKTLSIGSLDKQTLQSILDKHSISSEEIAWLRIANQIKQNGLYVDYSDNGWTTPSDATREEFEMGRKITDRMLLHTSWGL